MSFNNPYLELWSLGWRLKCSESEVIRSVISATWTSGEPVSLLFDWYFFITSFFFSNVNGIGAI